MAWRGVVWRLLLTILRKEEGTRTLSCVALAARAAAAAAMVTARSHGGRRRDDDARSLFCGAVVLRRIRCDHRFEILRRIACRRLFKLEHGFIGANSIAA